jgi:hypothetical protein
MQFATTPMVTLGTASLRRSACTVIPMELSLVFTTVPHSHFGRKIRLSGGLGDPHGGCGEYGTCVFNYADFEGTFASVYFWLQASLDFKEGSDEDDEVVPSVPAIATIRPLLSTSHETDSEECELGKPMYGLLGAVEHNLLDALGHLEWVR